MLTITGCHNCCFRTFDNEYGSNCNHPKGFNPNSEDNNNDIILHPDSESIPTDETSYGHYHRYTEAIPTWCPIRNLKNLSIGCEVNVKLDSRLFEENINK